MNKFRNILLTSDVDGTFFWNETYTNPRNIERIRYFVENGGLFCFSSGRNHRDIFLILPGMEELVNAPCVLCNGCMLFDIHSKTIQNPQYLDEQRSADLIRSVKRTFPDISFRISFTGGYLVAKGDEQIFADPRRHNLVAVSTFADIADFDGKQWFKAVFTGPEPRLEEVRRFMQREGGEAFSYCYSSPQILELLPPGITKAYQLNYLRRQLRQTRPDLQLWCIGDYDNDEEMLRCADVAACPANATDAVKKLCSVQVGHCRDGALADLVDEIEKRL